MEMFTELVTERGEVIVMSLKSIGTRPELWATPNSILFERNFIQVKKIQFYQQDAIPDLVDSFLKIK